MGVCVCMRGRGAIFEYFCLECPSLIFFFFSLSCGSPGYRSHLLTIQSVHVMWLVNETWRLQGFSLNKLILWAQKSFPIIHITALRLIHMLNLLAWKQTMAAGRVEHFLRMNVRPSLWSMRWSMWWMKHCKLKFDTKVVSLLFIWLFSLLLYKPFYIESLLFSYWVFNKLSRAAVLNQGGGTQYGGPANFLCHRMVLSIWINKLLYYNNPILIQIKMLKDKKSVFCDLYSHTASNNA